MSTPTIAKVLHLAADKFLAKDYDEFDTNPKKEKYSCFAIDRALESLKIEDKRVKSNLYDDIYLGLIRMGLIGGFSDFNEFERYMTTTPESQGARYAWLKFAAMIAEEQGV